MLASLLILAATAAAELRLDFTRTQIPGGLVKRKSVELPLYNELYHQKYTLNVTVGTPPQTFSLMADTASADLWLPLASSSACYPDCPPPTYDPRDSLTAKDTGLPFNATYGLTPDLHINGEYYNETVTIGGAKLENLTIATGDIPSTLYVSGYYGIIGIGSPFSEAVYVQPSSPRFGQANATFPTFWQQLALQGYVDKQLFSIWLDDQSASTGSILFGSIDDSKYIGELKSVPVITSGPNNLFTEWQVELTSVRWNAGDQYKRSENLTASNFSLTTILDSGSPNMYLPSALYDEIAAHYNVSLQTSQQTPYVPCSSRNSPSSLTFGLGDKHTGPRITVPIEEIIYPFGLPTQLGEVRDANGTELCYLGVIGTAGDIILLGDTFLRSAYVVFDADNLEVSFAPAKWGQ